MDLEILTKFLTQFGRRKTLALTVLLAALVGVAVAQRPAATPAAAAKPEAQAPAAKPAAEAKPEAEAPAAPAGPPKPFYIHAHHMEKLGKDGFECSLCHAQKEGSLVMKRPGHEQCSVCHQEKYDNVDQPFCANCHKEYPPTSAEDLVKYPLFKKDRAILFEFSHAKHVDPKARLNAKSGFRSDCTFCHGFDEKGVLATFPTHDQCGACHKEGGPKPLLTADSTTADCRNCHNPEEIENPGFTTERRFIAPHVVSGVNVNLKFSHQPHFKVKDKYKLDCTTCHYAVPASRSLADLTLPKMLDCVDCHDTSRNISAEFKMTNCSACHIDTRSGIAPASHTRNVRPAFHDGNFRRNHEAQASEAGAKCFVCHQGVTPSLAAKDQCTSCHNIMMPSSHTARWKEDLHGKFAAIDRQSCSTCHVSDSCSRCHNIQPRSHAPLALFLAGTHARLAMLDERACFTCHTFQNTCSRCHTQNIRAR